MYKWEKIILITITSILGTAAIVFLTLIILDSTGIKEIIFTGEAGQYGSIFGFVLSLIGFIVSLIVTIRGIK